MCRHTILVKKGALQLARQYKTTYVAPDEYIAVPEMDSLAYVCIRLMKKYMFM